MVFALVSLDLWSSVAATPTWMIALLVFACIPCFVLLRRLRHLLPALPLHYILLNSHLQTLFFKRPTAQGEIHLVKEARGSNQRVTKDKHGMRDQTQVQSGESAGLSSNSRSSSTFSSVSLFLVPLFFLFCHLFEHCFLLFLFDFFLFFPPLCCCFLPFFSNTERR